MEHETANTAEKAVKPNCDRIPYKIYLSEDTKARLINDAELFEFYRNDGTVNLNGFLKELIVNYFEQYRKDNDELFMVKISFRTVPCQAISRTCSCPISRSRETSAKR